MFSDQILTAALNAYGTSADTHTARLSTLATMLAATDSVTIDDVVEHVRIAAAQIELGVSFDTFNAQKSGHFK